MALLLHDGQALAAVFIFVMTYAVMALGKLPFYRIDRAGAALLGASLMVGLGVLSPAEALAAVDMSTITLLLGMMIVVANLRVAGFFHIVNGRVGARIGSGRGLLVGVVAVCGVLSAFLVNDTVCLVMTPLVAELVLARRLPPLPFMLAIAMASNVGSLATMTGNPQNMIVGSLSGLSYGSFVAGLAPVALVGLVVVAAFILVVHRRDLSAAGVASGVALDVPETGRQLRPLLAKTLAVLAAIVVLFFLGQPPGVVAIVGGAVLLLTRRVKPQRIYAEIDWPMLVMFTGLFIVVAGFEKTVVTADVVARVGALHLSDTAMLSLVTAVLSNVVSNVPAVLVLKPFLAGLSDPGHAWMVVAMASTLAGNFTLVGSVANLIVAQRAKALGIDVSFWSYFKIGAPLTVATIVIGALWIGLSGR